MRSKDTTEGDKVRFQVEMQGETVDDVKEMLRQTGLGTKKEFFSHALSTLAWCVREVLAGREIQSVDIDGGHVRVFELPFFNRLRRLSAAQKGGTK